VQSSLSTSGDAAATADLSGRCVGSSYVLVCPVGHGATGTVWRGIDRATGEYVAVKLLHEGLLRQPKLVIRFVQERTILMMMRHENIVGVRDLFSVGGSLALVMDYVSGGSLRNRLQSAGTLPPAEAASLLAQVAAALTQAHEMGVVHRDVKPDNILLEVAEDGRHEVRLTDFGIARVLDGAGLTTPQAIVGTPHYMAPEAIHGEAEPASDVYSVGVALFELVTGHPPYSGEPLAVLRRHLEESPAPPPGMPPEVWSLIEWCMDKEPARRPTAGELGGALRDLARQVAGVPALTSLTVGGESLNGLTAQLGMPHPSVRRPARRRPPRNGPRSWMFKRHGLMATLVAAAVVLSGLGGFNAWKLLNDAEKPAATGLQPLAPSMPATVASGAAGTGSSAKPLPRAVAGPQPAAMTGSLAGLGEANGAAPGAGKSRTGGGKAEASAGVSAGPIQGGAKVEFGPWQCGDEYSWNLGHPVLARPCHATGPAVRAIGQIEAAPGIQLDVSLTVRDAKSDEVVAGPYTCKGLMFTDFALKHSCGPADLDPPRGGPYVVAESWRYTERPLLPAGSARGPEFQW
jgi:serine/threonine-protein kinase